MKLHLRKAMVTNLKLRIAGSSDAIEVLHLGNGELSASTHCSVSRKSLMFSRLQDYFGSTNHVAIIPIMILISQRLLLFRAKFDCSRTIVV